MSQQLLAECYSAEALLTALAQQLEQSGHAYCILHGWERLGDGTMSDLDLAVSPSALAALEQLLEHDGWHIVQVVNYEIGGYLFIARQPRGDAFLHIDAITEFRAGGRLYLPASELLATPGKFRGFTIAAPEAEFAYLLTKKVLKGAIPQAQRRRLAVLRDGLAEEALRIAQRLFGLRWGAYLAAWIGNNRWDELEARLPVLRRALRHQSWRRYPVAAILDAPRELKRLVRRVLYPTGLVLALFGPDGTGKSTLARVLAARLSPVFGTTLQYHERPDIFGRLSYRTNPEPHARPLCSKSKSLLKLLFLLVDNGIGFQFKVRYPAIRSHLVVFDRYYHDLLVDPVRYRFGGPMWAARLASALIPAPDLFLLLDCPESVVLNRKRELPVEMLTTLRASYRAFTAGLAHARLIDASGDVHQVASAAEALICEYLHNRYLARRRLWFPVKQSQANPAIKRRTMKGSRIAWRAAE